jgi:hypothetical protein
MKKIAKISGASFHRDRLGQIHVSERTPWLQICSRAEMRRFHVKNDEVLKQNGRLAAAGSAN